MTNRTPEKQPGFCRSYQTRETEKTNALKKAVNLHL